MRILQLCKKFPFPLKDGESLAVNSLSRAWKELGCEVSLLAMNTTKHYYEPRELPTALNHYRQICTAPVDNRIKPLDALLNLFSRDSYHIARFISPAFRRELIRILRKEEFDLIQLETLYLAPYIPVIRDHSDAVIAMRAHNVEHEIWERIARNTRFWLRKWYLEHLTAKLRRYELEQLNRYDILVPISHRDLSVFQQLGAKGPAVATPIGIDHERYLPDFSSFKREPSIAFIGALDWMPNQEGLRWFLDHIWGRLARQFPGLKLHIAGRNTPAWLFNTRMRNVIVHGEVPDAAQFINAHSLFVVPLLSGSGMRAKILEGMALGKVVITTPLGLEGIAARHGQEVILADTLESFATVIRQAYQQPEQVEAIGHRARSFVIQHFDSQNIAQRLLDVYASLTVEAL